MRVVLLVVVLAVISLVASTVLFYKIFDGWFLGCGWPMWLLVDRGKSLACEVLRGVCTLRFLEALAVHALMVSVALVAFRISSRVLRRTGARTFVAAVISVALLFLLFALLSFGYGPRLSYLTAGNGLCLLSVVALMVCLTAMVNGAFWLLIERPRLRKERTQRDPRQAA